MLRVFHLRTSQQWQDLTITEQWPNYQLKLELQQLLLWIWQSGVTIHQLCTLMLETVLSEERKLMIWLTKTGKSRNSHQEFRREVLKLLIFEELHQLLQLDLHPSTTWETGLWEVTDGNLFASRLPEKNMVFLRDSCSHSHTPLPKASSTWFKT